MPDLAIITAIYGGYDNLYPTVPQEELDVDWVLVTDKPPEDPMGWRVVVDPRTGIHPNRAAKIPKIYPWIYSDAIQSIWMDSSFRVVSPRFAIEAIQYADPIAQFKHPWRNCIYEEAEKAKEVRKKPSQRSFIDEQIEFYRTTGHPEDWGLWATGIIARKHTEDILSLSTSWRFDIDRWSFHDQISQAYSLRLSGIRPNEFPGDYFSSPWIEYKGHI